jgi:acyl carrier protein
MDDLERRLKSCFSVEFPELGDDVRNASMMTVEHWDSVATVNLVNLLEEEFGIQIGLEDVEHLMSFDQFLDYLRTRSAFKN